MLRFALLQLSSLEGNAAVDTGSLNNITSLLQVCKINIFTHITHF